MCVNIIFQIHERDHKCVVTKVTNPTVSAHTIPYSYNNMNNAEKELFWNVLRQFCWDEEKVK